MARLPNTPEAATKSHFAPSPSPAYHQSTVKLFIATQNHASKLNSLVQELHDQNQARGDYISAVHDYLQEMRERTLLQSPGFRLKGMLAYLQQGVEDLRVTNDKLLAQITKEQFGVWGVEDIVQRALSQ